MGKSSYRIKFEWKELARDKIRMEKGSHGMRFVWDNVHIGRSTYAIRFVEDNV